MSENEEKQGFIFGMIKIFYYYTLIGASFTFGVLLMIDILKLIKLASELIF